MFPFEDVIVRAVTQPTSSVSFFGAIFQNDQNTVYLIHITFISAMCHHSLAVVKSAKHERDVEGLRITFAKV